MISNYLLAGFVHSVPFPFLGGEALALEQTVNFSSDVTCLAQYFIYRLWSLNVHKSTSESAIWMCVNWLCCYRSSTTIKGIITSLTDFNAVCEPPNAHITYSALVHLNKKWSRCVGSITVATKTKGFYRYINVLCIHCRCDEEGNCSVDALLNEMTWVILALMSPGNVSNFCFFRCLCRAHFSCSGWKAFDQAAFECK